MYVCVCIYIYICVCVCVFFYVMCHSLLPDEPFFINCHCCYYFHDKFCLNYKGHVTVFVYICSYKTKFALFL
jgi:hypothetical protein